MNFNDFIANALRDNIESKKSVPNLKKMKPFFSFIYQKVRGQAKLYTPSTLNIEMKLILLWVLAERAVLGRAKTALKFKYEIEIG